MSMFALHHPLIAGLHGAALVPTQPLVPNGWTHLVIIMEYVECQNFQRTQPALRSITLDDYRSRYEGSRMPEHVVKHFAYQLLTALQHAHTDEIAHRDLKVRSRQRGAAGCGAVTPRCGI